MDKGFIKLSRSFFDNKIWQAARAFSECEAWLDLIQSARFEASPTTSRIGCYEVTWGRGQYPASNRFLAKKWGRSEQWVKSFLGKLKREKMITTDNAQGVNIISLVNFDKYNGEPDCNPPCNPVNNPPKVIADSELQGLITHLVTQQVTHLLGNAGNLQPTPNPNNKKEEEYISKETSSDEDAKKDPLLKARFDNLTKWMQENTPNVLRLSSPLTEKQYAKIKEKYNSDQLKHILLAMENYKELNKRYRSVYLTFLKWASKEYGTT